MNLAIAMPANIKKLANINIDLANSMILLYILRSAKHISVNLLRFVVFLYLQLLKLFHSKWNGNNVFSKLAALGRPLRLSVKAGMENRGTEWREWWECGVSGWECGESGSECGESGWEWGESGWESSYRSGIDEL